MMEGLRVRYQVSGLGIERLLNTLQAQGFRLSQVERTQQRGVSFSVPLAQRDALVAVVREMGFGLEELAATGLMQPLRRLRKRKLLLIAGLLSLAMVFAALQFIWHIEITGAGIYGGEVRSYLREQDIRPGMLRRSLDLKALCNDLVYRLPRIAWARATISGVTLQIEITQGVPAPDVRLSDAGDLVASCDGVIHAIDVFSGTAAVKPGDTVRAGDVLIQGVEKGLYDQEKRAVHAQGRVTARVWRQAQAVADLYETVSQPTGQVCEYQYFACPWGCWPSHEEPSFLTSDVERTRQPLGGCFLPLWLETVRYTEVSLRRERRDTASLESETGAQAMCSLLSLCGIRDEIIDKTLNFSMIEGDTILATATAEMLVDIGRFSPRKTD